LGAGKRRTIGEEKVEKSGEERRERERGCNGFATYLQVMV